MWVPTSLLCLLAAVAAGPSGEGDPAKLLAQGYWCEAEAQARRELAALESRDRPPFEATAAALDQLVTVLVTSAQGPMPEALRLAERAVALRRSQPVADPVALATSLANLVRTLVEASDVERAMEVLEEARRLVAGTARPEHAESVRLLLEQARLERLRGHGEQAAAATRLALAASARRLGTDNLEGAQCLTVLGVGLLDAHHPEEARSALEQALAIRSRLLGERHPLVAELLNALGVSERRLGHIGRARQLLERAAELQAARLGAEHVATARTYVSLANLAREEGDYREARRLSEQALAVLERAFGPSSAQVAGVLENLGLVLSLAGDHVAALDACRRVLAVREAELGPDHPEVARALSNQAVALMKARRWGEADPLLRRALGIRERTSGPDSPSLVPILTNLGEVARVQGDEPEAERQLTRAVGIVERGFGADHPRLATLLNNLGLLHLQAGQTARALPLLTRAAAIFEATYEPDNPILALPLRNLGRAYADGGETSRGLELALRAESIGRAHLALMARSLSEREALGYAAARPSGLDLALSLAMTGRLTQSEVEAVWDAALRGRNQVLSEMTMRRRALESAPTEAATEVEELQTAASELARLLVEGGESPDHAEMAAARQRLEKAERDLAAVSAAFRQDLGARRPGLDAVRAALPPGSALVSLFRFRRYLDLEGKPPPESDVRYFGALVTRAGEGCHAKLLASSEEIDDAVESFRRSMAAGAAAGSGSEQVRVAGSRLRSLVWDPLRPLLGDAGLVLVVPDGQLHLVNLVALPDAEREWLLETGPCLHVLSHERDVLAASVASRQTGGLLAVGGPDFDLGSEPVPSTGVAVRGGCVDLSTVRFSALPAAAAEAEAVARLWSSSMDRGPAVVLSGREASEPGLRANASGRQVLHLATHGFFLAESCGETTLSGRGIGGLAPARQQESPEQEPQVNPLHLSGLVLAGANHRESAASGAEDGILTAEEIATLDLSGAGWAVLSACDSGIGELDVHEGVLGLRRAFLAAGVRTVITSLMAVADDSARRWMEALYRARLDRGETTAAAARAASLELLASRRAQGEEDDPWTWGAFLAVGDWR